MWSAELLWLYKVRLNMLLIVIEEEKRVGRREIRVNKQTGGGMLRPENITPDYSAAARWADTASVDVYPPTPS